MNSKCEHGVDFTVKISLFTTVETPANSWDKILTFRLKTNARNVHTFTAYVPTFYGRVKDQPVYSEVNKKFSYRWQIARRNGVAEAKTRPPHLPICVTMSNLVV